MINQQKQSIWQVIMASSAGTLIEWYDFYIFGSLSAIIAEKFFPPSNPDLAYIFTLATFAVGFIVRPFGAIVFGRLGDLTGRKYTFLLTLLLMGGSTFAIGLVPDYSKIGILAPLIVLVLRLIQGLALGGEYGGAATYVAEHSPVHQRGYYTSFIQTTATLGLFVSLAVILITRGSMTPENFSSWGWRVPFLLSVLLVIMSYYIRMRLQESPLFAQLKAEGKTSTNPIKESFGKKENLQLVLLALFGAAMGQGVVWYTGQFYALSFLQKTMQIEFVQSNLIIAAALVLGTPFFVYFGRLSDKIGRKKIMITGMVLAALTYYPIYAAMDHIGDTKLKTANDESISNNISRNARMQNIEKTIKTTYYTDGSSLMNTTTKTDGKEEAKTELKVGTQGMLLLILLVLIQVIYVTMVYGPIAAFLVELFPTRIRYTSMSLPYHIGNGVFGGLLPVIATALVTSTHHHLAGIIYPIVIALLCAIIGGVFIKQRMLQEK
jgi:MFS family permease